MNQIINSSDLKDKIKFGLSGTYLFFGEEEYMKYYYLNEVRKNVLPKEDAFMFHKKISCIDFDVEKITDALTTTSLSFFEGKTLVELHEIQFKTLKEAEWKALCQVLSEISNDVIAVIYTTPDEFDEGFIPKSPSKDLKRLLEYVTAVQFPKEGELKLLKWIARHFASEKLSYENRVCDMLLSRCGRDMFVLSGEIEKLCAYVKFNGETRITEKDVMTVCSENLEMSAFDFSNAILEGSTDRAYSILSDMKLRKEKPVYIFAAVSKTLSEMFVIKELLDGGATDAEISKKIKMHEYKVGIYRKNIQKRSRNRIRSLLRLCCETDIKLKNSKLESYTELDKLVIVASAL